VLGFFMPVFWVMSYLTAPAPPCALGNSASMHVNMETPHVTKSSGAILDSRRLVSKGRDSRMRSAK